MAGHEPPTGSEAVKAVLRGLRRTIGIAKQGKAPATADLIGQMVALCPDNMIGKRDRALLCLGFAGAFRRSELCALEVADLTEVPDELRILIRRSKGDQEGQGARPLHQRHGNARGTPHQRQSNAGHMEQCTRAANGPGHGAVIARQGSRSAPRVHCRGLASCNVGMRHAISAA